MNTKLYIVTFEWGVSEDMHGDPTHGVETAVFAKPYEALALFQQYIKEECDPGMSWVGLFAFDKGVIQEGYRYNYTVTQSECGIEAHWSVESTTDDRAYSKVGLVTTTVEMEGAPDGK